MGDEVYYKLSKALDTLPNTFMEMVRPNKMGLVVIDASMVMQGLGPSVH